MIFLAIILSSAGWAVAGNLNVVHEWKCLDYSWNSVEDRQAAIDSGKYIPKQVFLLDVDIFEDSVFVTTPRLTAGVPATLATVSDKTGRCGHLLEPYPDWSWHTGTDCKGFTNVWRVTIDKCNRLWVLDSGVINKQRVCPASLTVFDAKTNKLLNRYDLPDEMADGTTAERSLITPVVETHGLKCRDTWVYMADSLGSSLLVWHKNVTWTLRDDIFAPIPNATTFTVAGQTFEFTRGVHALALSPPPKRFSLGRLYFKPLSSFNMFSVSLSDLHNSTISRPAYRKSGFQLPSQTAALDFSRRGVMFFGLVSEMSLACWNIKRPLNADNVVTVAQDDETLQFASGIKVKRLPVRHSHSEYVWVATNRFQKTLTDTRNLNETNFRILVGHVDNLIAGTNCIE